MLQCPTVFKLSFTVINSNLLKLLFIELKKTLIELSYIFSIDDVIVVAGVEYENNEVVPSCIEVLATSNLYFSSDETQLHLTNRVQLLA